MYGMPVMILAPIASEFQNMPSHHAAPLSSQVWIRFTNDTAVVEACTASEWSEGSKMSKRVGIFKAMQKHTLSLIGRAESAPQAEHGAVSSPERTAVALARSCSRARPGIGKKQRHYVNE